MGRPAAIARLTGHSGISIPRGRGGLPLAASKLASASRMQAQAGMAAPPPSPGVPPPSSSSSSRVVGRHGNTSKGRLDRLDALLEVYEPRLFAVGAAAAADRAQLRGSGRPALSEAAVGLEVCVDVGFGDTVDTFIDFASRLRARRDAGTLRVIGTESDANRLAAGQASLAALHDDSLALRLAESQGWFVLPLQKTEPAVFIRALNVLRDYHPAHALRGMQTLGAQLAPGGLLMEGSASTPGHVAVVALVRRPHEVTTSSSGSASAAAAQVGVDEAVAALRLEALCFCVDFDRQDAPKLKGGPNRWFSRQIPQLWQHQHTKAGGGAATTGSGTERQPPAEKKRKRGADRKWLGGGG